MRPDDEAAKHQPSHGPSEVLKEIDRLLREDYDIGKAMEAVKHAQNARMRYYAQRMREEAAPFEQQLAPLLKQHTQLRNAVLALWAEAFDTETTLEIPTGKVSRRNYRELIIRDKAKLLAALDRNDRLDLVDHTFDEKALLSLLDKRKLTLPDGTVEIRDHYNLQFHPEGP